MYIYFRVNQYTSVSRIEYKMGHGYRTVTANSLYMWFSSIFLTKKEQYKRIARDFMGL